MMPQHKRLALLACAGLLAACQGSEQDEPSEPADTGSAADLPALSVGEPPFDRADLLGAVANAASDHAIGRDDSGRQRELDGRLFELRLRFGCEGSEDETRGWTYDEQDGVLRISVEPEITAATPLIADQDFAAVEAVEGFWIRRPWLLEAACPAVPPDAVASDAPTEPQPGPQASAAPEEARPAPALPRVGIAQLFTAEDSRLRRRDSRAYQTTVKLAKGESPSRAGYDFVLSGRLTRLPNGKTISCIAVGVDAPPACIIGAELDRASLTRPDGEVLAEWSRG